MFIGYQLCLVKPSPTHNVVTGCTLWWLMVTLSPRITPALRFSINMMMFLSKRNFQKLVMALRFRRMTARSWLLLYSRFWRLFPLQVWTFLTSYRVSWMIRRCHMLSLQKKNDITSCKDLESIAKNFASDAADDFGILREWVIVCSKHEAVLLSRASASCGQIGRCLAELP